MKQRLRAALVFLITAAVAAGAIAIAALVVARKVRTGSWHVPDRSDVHWVANRIKSELRPNAAAPRIIYLHRDPITLVGGPEFSHENRSGLLANRQIDRVELEGFKGSKRTWEKIVRCVELTFAPFELVVTEQRPRQPGYVMVVVAGRPTDIGLDKGSHVAGLAPFNGKVIPDPIVFAFSRELRHDYRDICHTIAMEVGHAYGLDHSYQCKDVMTYQQGCGAKRFVDEDVRCGESKPRDCEGGKPTQNSFRHMVSVLGERKPVERTAVEAAASKR